MTVADATATTNHPDATKDLRKTTLNHQGTTPAIAHARLHAATAVTTSDAIARHLEAQHAADTPIAGPAIKAADTDKATEALHDSLSTPAPTTTPRPDASLQRQRRRRKRSQRTRTARQRCSGSWASRVFARRRIRRCLGMTRIMASISARRLSTGSI